MSTLLQQSIVIASFCTGSLPMARPQRDVPPMPLPDLSTLAKARMEIDAIDERIIEMLARRQLVTAAALRFTPLPNEQPRTERLLTGIQKRCTWAKAHGIDPTFIEILFSTMMARDLSADAQRRAQLSESA
jgi:chorismate mutase